MWIAKYQNRHLRDTEFKHISNAVKLYNREPYLYDHSWLAKTQGEHWNNYQTWFTCHGNLTLTDEVANRFDWLQFEDGPQECDLVIDNDNPDFYIQRIKENLFIANRTYKSYWFSGRITDDIGHSHRLKPSMFPQIKDENGIQGVKIILKNNERMV